MHYGSISRRHNLWKGNWVKANCCGSLDYRNLSDSHFPIPYANWFPHASHVQDTGFRPPLRVSCSSAFEGPAKSRFSPRDRWLGEQILTLPTEKLLKNRNTHLSELPGSPVTGVPSPQSGSGSPQRAFYWLPTNDKRCFAAPAHLDHRGQAAAHDKQNPRHSSDRLR
jgi:hypothetical protein